MSSAASFPPLPPELVAFVQGGVSLLTGTCSADLVPESVRGVGLRIWPCASRLTVLMPKATAEIAVANMRANGRLAVTMAEIETLRTVQMKGTVIEIRDANDEEHRLVLSYTPKFRKALAFVGLPEGVTSGLAVWPAWAIDLAIVNVFAQTPGPLAGVKMPLASGALVP